jgi:hypothetical protein
MIYFCVGSCTKRTDGLTEGNEGNEEKMNPLKACLRFLCCLKLFREAQS